MPHHKKFDFGVPKGQEGELKPEALTQHNRKNADAYDNDLDTASPYDDMPHHKKFDFGVPKGQEGELKPEALTQHHKRTHKKHHHHHRRQ
mmetsp:Transcript_2537/g.4259  ORF Transcript_2537/g.4259 Transcript_2537/m.4259 type:complete len:90 (+) Transcript_2537:564-833(+)